MNADWRPSSAATAPPTDDSVFCWRVCVDDFDESACRALLNKAERARADRFVRTADRRLYIVAHASLRWILAKALRVDPRYLVITDNRHGKPYIPGKAPSFNLTHSGDIALIVLAAGFPVGVDIERVRELPDGDLIAQRFFHVKEISELDAQPAAERTRAFYRCWTQKEAVVKALGQGLTYPLDSFRVACVRAAAHWSLVDLEPTAGYIGALAAAHHPISVQRLTLAHIGDP